MTREEMIDILVIQYDGTIYNHTNEAGVSFIATIKPDGIEFQTKEVLSKKTYIKYGNLNYSGIKLVYDQVLEEKREQGNIR